MQDFPCRNCYHTKKNLTILIFFFSDIFTDNGWNMYTNKVQGQKKKFNFIQKIQYDDYKCVLGRSRSSELGVPFSTRHRNCGVNNNKVPTPIKLDSTNKQAIQ